MPAPGSAQTRVNTSRRLEPAHNPVTDLEQQTNDGKWPTKRPRSGFLLDPEAEDSNSQVISVIHPETVQLLVEHGPDLFQKTQRTSTSLHLREKVILHDFLALLKENSPCLVSLS